MSRYREITDNGYKVIAFAETDGCGFVIVGEKEKPYVGIEYVVASFYDPNDGIWGYGNYTYDRETAMEIFAKYLVGDTVFIATYESDEDPREILGVFRTEDAAKDAVIKHMRECDPGYKLDEYNHCLEYCEGGVWYEWNIEEETVK